MRTITPASMTDLYELTMAAGYWADGRPERAVFELFVRRLPERRGFLLASGLEDALGYLEALHFTSDEIAYLHTLPALASAPAGFFRALDELRFTGDVWALPEGTPVFGNEPILTVSAPLIEAQIVETALLACICYPTSVASKAARIVRAAQGRGVVEFGARRAPGTDAALIAARAAYVGGCIGTSNIEAGHRFGLPVYGTMAHAWVMSFDDEVEAFRRFVAANPSGATLLIDTYDTLRAARRIVRTFRPEEILGVRLDSGDLVALSRDVRAILDEGGFTRTTIFASGDLDERRIAELIRAGAAINSFGVGTELTTVRDAPSLSAVYKLAELQHEGHVHLKIKLSAEKSTYPGRKQVWRTVDAEGRYAADVITFHDEPPPAPEAMPLCEMVMTGGRRIAPSPTPLALQRRAADLLALLPDRLFELEPPPQPYPVRFSEALKAAQGDIRARLTRL